MRLENRMGEIDEGASILHKGVGILSFVNQKPSKFYKQKNNNYQIFL